MVTEKVYVILNPYANRWRAGQRKPEILEALTAQGLEVDIVETTGVGHAAELAQAAAQAGDALVVAAGGDGTIGEVVNGLHRASPEGPLGPLGILPLGTANDLVVNLGLPATIQDAASAIRTGRTRRIDLGQVNEWVFANNSAVGLEPVVTIYNIRMTWLRGVIRYLVAALRTIAAEPSWEMNLSWDDGSYDGPVSLVSVGNCPITGGLFRMAPAAEPDDGKLTFVHAYAETKWSMLALLPRAISGEYVEDPRVHQHHTRELRIQCNHPSPLQADGEIRSEGETTFSYRVLPARLDVITA